ncbi:MAG: hypothetical protein KKF80_06805 [Candidatus Omnitrophica bacterium]|nr:hypothetical protein [Candidatus Omnitrophota bacterium]
MLSASRMELVSVAVLKGKVEVLLKRLIDAGIFHPVDIRHIDASLHELSGLQMEKERADVEALQVTAREINRALDVRISPEPGSESLSSEEIRRSLSELQRRIEPVVARRNEHLQSLKTKEAMIVHLKDYFPLPFKRNAFYTFLDVSLGEISEKDFDALARSLVDVPHVVYPVKHSAGYATIVVIGLRRDRAFVERVLRDFSWRKVELPQESGDVSRAATEKLAVEIA